MITDITHQMAHNAAYLVKVSQKDSNNIQMQKNKNSFIRYETSYWIDNGLCNFYF